MGQAAKITEKDMTPIFQYRKSLVCLTSFIIVFYQGCGQFSSQSENSSGSLSFADNPSKVCAVNEPGFAPLRRLAQWEYKYSVQDIFNINFNPSILPDDTIDYKGYAKGAEGQFLTFDGIELYKSAAEKVVSDAFANNSQVLKCASDNNSQNYADNACAEEIIYSVAEQAWRKTLDEETKKHLWLLFEKAQQIGANPQEAMETVLQAVFLSPQFLYLPSSEVNQTLSSHTIASRLSYFLWTSIPDNTLRKLASEDKLQDPEVLKAQVKRMLNDPKAERFANNFISGWLKLPELSNSADVSVEGLSDELRAAMKKESRLFFADIVKKDLGPADILNGEFTYLNPFLAEHYGISIPNLNGDEFVRVNTSSVGRKGILTQGSLLTKTSGSTYTKPTGRGNFILSTITCTPPPPFPDNGAVSPLIEPNPNATIRENLAIHRSSPACMGCHVRMDSVGLGLENFDQLGRWRDIYAKNNLSIDPSGELDGKSFNNHSQLIEQLSIEDFGKCLSERLISYAVGRTVGESDDDKCMVSKIAEAKVVNGTTFSDLVISVVLSDAFTRNEDR